MTTIAHCFNDAEAMLLKSLLEANGITAYVPDELAGQSLVLHFTGSGLRIQVEDEDAEAARKILAEAENHEPDEELPQSSNPENQSR